MKFRAYSLVDKKFLKQMDVCIDGAGDILIYNEAARGWYFPEEKIVIQYSIGMKDKNGTEIYEGDIVECYKWFNGLENRPVEKKRIEVSCSLEHNLETVHESGWEGSWIVEDIEIVGNIWSKQ